MPKSVRVASSERAHTMAVGFLVDGEGPFSLEEMERDNPDDPDLISHLRQLKPGDVLREGGGAWAEFIIKAVAMTSRQRATHLSRPSDLRPGERVRNLHGEVGIVVGPGAAGERVIIQWDDGSTSNLSAVDLGLWGVERDSSTIHAHGAATLSRGDNWADFCDRLKLSIDLVCEANDRSDRGTTLQEWSRRIGERLRMEQGESRRLARIGDVRRNGTLRRTPTRARTAQSMSSSLLRAGERIELVAMPDDPNPIPAGTCGTVEWASDVDLGGTDRFTQVGVRWDNGSSLMLSIPPDRIRKI